MTKFENDWYNKGYDDGFADGSNAADVDFDMEKFAVWKSHKVIGHMELTEEQRQALNSISGIDVYFGNDERKA